VPPEKLSSVSEPFSAVGLRSAAGYASSGLGLAFCKLATEGQGGTIGVLDSAWTERRRQATQDAACTWARARSACA